jgi:hypothetical protein
LTHIATIVGGQLVFFFMALTPESLVVGGRVIHDIYHTATLATRRTDLVRGRARDGFRFQANDPWDANGTIPDCQLTLAVQE